MFRKLRQVKADQDLLDDSGAVIVPKGMHYDALMLYGQRFSSLFRHYAKKHSLNPESLEYYDASPSSKLLDPTDTPKTLSMGRFNTVLVRQKTLGSRKRPADDSQD